LQPDGEKEEMRQRKNERSTKYTFFFFKWRSRHSLTEEPYAEENEISNSKASSDAEICGINRSVFQTGALCGRITVGRRWIIRAQIQNSIL